MRTVTQSPSRNMTRWITGIILVFLTIILLAIVPVFYLKWFVVVLSGVAAWEFFSMSVPHVPPLFKYLGSVLTLWGCVLIGFDAQIIHFHGFLCVILVFAFLSQFLGEQTNRQRIAGASFFVFGVLYCAVLFGLMMRLFDLRPYPFWVVLALACTYGGDTGAYLVGKKWGKHKLCQSLSPHKTVEGAVGALLVGLLAAVLVRGLFWGKFSLPVAMVLGISTALMGLLGDLSESLIKRGFAVKDSGTIIPGHGGLLDRVDSLLFSAPFVYFVAEFFKR